MREEVDTVIILSVLNIIISCKHLRAFFSLQGQVEMKKLFDTGSVVYNVMACGKE